MKLTLDSTNRDSPLAQSLARDVIAQIVKEYKNELRRVVTEAGCALFALKPGETKTFRTKPITITVAREAALEKMK